LPGGPGSAPPTSWPERFRPPGGGAPPREPPAPIAPGPAPTLPAALASGRAPGPDGERSSLSGLRSRQLVRQGHLRGDHQGQDKVKIIAPGSGLVAHFTPMGLDDTP